MTHFLNAVLGDALSQPIRDVDIVNTENEREVIDDRLSVVDLTTGGAAGHVFQIEVHLPHHRDLPAAVAAAASVAWSRGREAMNLSTLLSPH